MTSGSKLLLPEESREHLQVSFTYSVKWISTDLSFDQRFEKFLDHAFFEHKVVLVTYDPDDKPLIPIRFIGFLY